jgi:hypothetical protein
MKKSIVAAVLGLGAMAVSSYGQGQITLDTYNSSSLVYVTQGGVGITGGFYVGLYYGPANSNINGSVAADPSGTADPISLYSGFTLATGNGAVVNTWVGTQGQFANILSGGGLSSFLIQPTGTTQNSYSLMVVTYNNAAGYDQSTIRGHSAAFYMQSGNPITANSGDVGLGGMPSFAAFNVAPVPEPGTLALAGLGGFGMLMALRRKKA